MMHFVTSWGGDAAYALAFLASWRENVNLPITAYLEEDADSDDLVEARNLWDVPGAAEFVDLCQFPAMSGNVMGGHRNYRFDVKKFCRKSFAQVDMAASLDGGWLYWVDADTEWSGCPFVEFDWSDDVFMVYMDRPEWHSCASFVGWNLDHPMASEFFETYYNLYLTGTIFCLPEWHDSFVLDWLRDQMKIPAIDMAAHIPRARLKGPANVFNEVFPMAHHKKGNLKKQ